jgi:hypothetical protein
MFRKLVNPQLQSSLITDMASFSGCVEESGDVGLPEHSMTIIPVDIYNALRTLRSFPLPRRAKMLSHLTIKGAMYTVASKHLGNSCVLISSAAYPPFPAQIHSILWLHTPDAVEAFVTVHRYMPVHVDDPYTRYPALRAKIWGREVAKDIEVVSVDDIQCHIAVCPILWDGSAVNVVISLFRVCIHLYLDAIYTHLLEGICLGLIFSPLTSEMQGSGYPHEYFPGVFRGLGQGLTVWTPYPSRVTQGYCDTPGYNVTIIKEH